MKKIFIKVYGTSKARERAFKVDSEMFSEMDLLESINRTEKSLEVKYATIKYYSPDNLTDMRGFSCDMAIIDELHDPNWENECLAPALCSVKGKIVKCNK